MFSRIFLRFDFFTQDIPSTLKCPYRHRGDHIDAVSSNHHMYNRYARKILIEKGSGVDPNVNASNSTTLNAFAKDSYFESLEREKFLFISDVVVYLPN